MESFFEIIANFGFPVAVAGYLLFRFENKIEKLDDSICGEAGLIAQVRQLKKAIEDLTKEIEKQR